MKFYNPIIILFIMVCSGCSHLQRNTVFYLADRQIRVEGIEPATGRVITVPKYLNEESYCLPVHITKVEIEQSASPSLSGIAKYRVVVVENIHGCPFHSNDVIFLTGAPSPTLQWATNDGMANIVLKKVTNEFLDFIPTTKVNSTR